jgi:hypothetical protein
MRVILSLLNGDMMATVLHANDDPNNLGRVSRF